VCAPYDGAMSDTQDLVVSIDERIVEARKEIASLEAALAAITDASAPTSPKSATPKSRTPKSRTPKSDTPKSRTPRSATPKPGTPNPTTLKSPAPRSAAPESATGPKPRARRSPRPRPVEVVPAGKLETLLSASDGLSTTALAERANGGRDQVLTLLRELEAAGRIRRTGQRRATRWHVITDEDRIAARVAELERRRR
jgi:hypothetical protein